MGYTILVSEDGTGTEVGSRKQLLGGTKKYTSSARRE